MRRSSRQRMECESVVIYREGPTGLLVTTTSIALDPELETRMLSIPITDTPEQTSAVLMGTAASFAGRTAAEVDFVPWHTLQLWLEQSGVRSAIVPYAEELARTIPPLKNRLRRDFPTILKLVQTHAILHQAQRERDDQGRVIANLDDYGVVDELAADLIEEAVEASVPKAMRETVEAVRKLTSSLPANRQYVSSQKLAEHLKLNKSSVSRRVTAAGTAKFIVNLEKRRGFPDCLVLGAPLPEEQSILPAPDTLMPSGDISPGAEPPATSEGIAPDCDEAAKLMQRISY